MRIAGGVPGEGAFVVDSDEVGEDFRVRIGPEGDAVVDQTVQMLGAEEAPPAGGNVAVFGRLAADAGGPVSAGLTFPPIQPVFQPRKVPFSRETL